MPLQPIPFARHSYQDRSLPVSVQRLVNLYGEPKPGDAKSQFVLHGTPGLASFATVGTGPIRGMIGMGDYLYVASGAELYRVDQYGTATLAGIISGTRVVSMATNGTQVVIACDVDVFYATATDFGTLSPTNCTDVTVHDGYAIFGQRNTQQFFISAVNDVTTFDPLEFALANALPDNVVAVRNANRETWVFGERSIQVYYNSGQQDFPFTRTPSGVMQRGCLAPRSVADYQGALFWLGDDKRVYLAEGQAPRPISTFAIDREISTYAAPEEAHAFVYSQEGHVFYCLTFAEGTWCYDVVTGLWHERLSEGLTKWRAQSHANHFQTNYAGDALTGAVYALSLDTYTEAGNELRRIATAPPINGGRYRLTMSRLEIDMEVGVGLASGQGSNPQIALDWSDDGGSTWSNEKWKSLGAQGARNTRVFWTRLGQFRQRTLRVSISDPVKVAIYAAYADIEGGEA